MRLIATIIIHVINKFHSSDKIRFEELLHLLKFNMLQPLHNSNLLLFKCSHATIFYYSFQVKSVTLNERKIYTFYDVIFVLIYARIE